MPEIVLPVPGPAPRPAPAQGPAAPCSPAPRPSRPRAASADRGRDFRSRIGVDRAGGYYPAPHRYLVYLCPGCPDSLRVAITLGLLARATPGVPAAPDSAVSGACLVLPADTPEGHGSLRAAYEATLHHYDGPLTVPALCDRWSGRIVSNHTPDILRDLVEHLSTPRRDHAAGPGGHLPDLRPPGLAAEIDALHDLLHADVTGAARLAGSDPDAQRREEANRTLLQALDRLDRRLAGSPYVLGEDLTAADVDLWVALVELDLLLRPQLDAAAADRIAGHDRLRAYVRRLHGHPAFHGNLRADDMTRLHRATGTPPGGGTGWLDHHDGA